MRLLYIVVDLFTYAMSSTYARMIWKTASTYVDVISSNKTRFHSDKTEDYNKESGLIIRTPPPSIAAECLSEGGESFRG